MMKHTWFILAIICVSFFKVAENLQEKASSKNPPPGSDKMIELPPDIFAGNRIPITRHSKRMMLGDSREPKPMASYKSSPKSLHNDVQVRWGNDFYPNFDTNEFVITVGVGTPPKAYTLEIDTGSSLTWMHCECNGCSHDDTDYESTGVFLSQSSTSHKVFCGTSLCVLTGETLCSDDQDSYPDCPFRYGYVDGSISTGYVYQDTIWFTEDITVPNFTFGCATKARGFGKVDGVLGLGEAPTSVFKQSPVPIDGFQYCLPGPEGERGFLTIGRAGWWSNRFQYTKLLTRKAHPEYYYVDLTHMSVNGTRLRVHTKNFTGQGAIIDCGAVHSYIPQDALNVMKQIVRQQMKGYGVEVDQDECYDLTRIDGPIEVPSVTLHFNDGAAWELSPEGILYDPEPYGTRRRRCLAFDKASSFTIIGNLAQVSRQMVYDLKNRTIGFGPADSC